MNSDAFLSTGEAAELLGLSRSTVSRRFDAGTLQGKVNPLTGERLISRQSVLDFVRRHDLPVSAAALSACLVAVGSTDATRRAALAALFANDPRVHVEAAASGADVLVACGRRTPNLLIIDDSFTDIAMPNIVESLKKTAVGETLRILCAVTPDRAEVAERAGADGILDASRPDAPAHRVAVYRALRIPQTPPPHNPVLEYQRRWSRVLTRFNARLFVYRLLQPDERLKGKAVVEDISRQGARLTGIHMENGMLPAEPFRLVLEIDEAPLTKWSATCRVMRLQSDGPIELGVQFAEISEMNLGKIITLQSEH